MQIKSSRHLIYGRLEVPLAYVARHVDNELPKAQYHPLSSGVGSLHIEFQWIQLRPGVVSSTSHYG